MLNDRTTTASTAPESRSLSRCRSKNFMTFSCAERKFRDELVGDSFLFLAVVCVEFVLSVFLNLLILFHLLI